MKGPALLPSPGYLPDLPLALTGKYCVHSDGATSFKLPKTILEDNDGIAKHFYHCVNAPTYLFGSCKTGKNFHVKL